jgi:hypothetical protein
MNRGILYCFVFFALANLGFPPTHAVAFLELNRPRLTYFPFIIIPVPLHEAFSCLNPDILNSALSTSCGTRIAVFKLPKACPYLNLFNNQWLNGYLSKVQGGSAGNK